MKQIIMYRERFTKAELNKKLESFKEDRAYFQQDINDLIEDMGTTDTWAYNGIESNLIGRVKQIKQVNIDITNIEYVLEEWDNIEMRCCGTCRQDTIQVFENNEHYKYRCLECDNVDACEYEDDESIF